MGISKYLQECWIELWNPDSRQWQYIDRVLFLVLPVVSLLPFVFSRIPVLQMWGDIMTNLVWIIPLSVWVLFLLLVIPYRLVSRYRNGHRVVIDGLLELYQAGDKLKTAVFARHDDNEGAMRLYKEWGTMVANFFSANPRELGLARLLSLKVENLDLNILIPDGWSKDDESTGIYIMLAVQMVKLNSIIQDLLRRG